MSSIITTNRNRIITAPTYTSTSTMPRNSACSSSHRQAVEKKVRISESTACTGFFMVITMPADSTVIAAKAQKAASSKVIVPSAVGRVCGAAAGDLRLETIAQRQQLRLGDDVFAAVLEVVFVAVRLDDRIDRAAFLAEAAIDALEQVDVVARGAAAAVLARLGVDGDRQRRAHRLAKLAGDAALFPVGVAAQRVQAAEARRLRELLVRVVHRVLRL